MKRCTECKEHVVAGLQTLTLKVGERSFEAPVAGWSCPSCREQYYQGGSLEAFEEAVAMWVAEHGITSSQDIRFMRKAAGIRAADLASWLNVSAETVSHWETGKHRPDVATLATIASIVLETLSGESSTKDRLRAHKQPDAATAVRLPPVAA